MASPDEFKLTFLRGSGFLHSLVGSWDLMADVSGPWLSQKGFLNFEETKLVSVIERQEGIRRGIECTYSVEGNRILITELFVDTTPEQGALNDLEFELDGDLLTVKWQLTNPMHQTFKQVDKFRRRREPGNKTLLTEGAIYHSWNRG